jgi:hypothetical protein
LLLPSLTSTLAKFGIWLSPLAALANPPTSQIWGGKKNDSDERIGECREDWVLGEDAWLWLIECIRYSQAFRWQDGAPPTPPLNLLWSAATCAAGLQRSTKEVTYKAAGRVAVGRLKAPFTCRTEIELFSFEFLAGPLDVKMGGCFCVLPLEKEKNTNKRNICEEERMTES